MNNKITLLSEEFENEQTGNIVEGITIIVDGPLKKFFEVIIAKNPKYINNIRVKKTWYCEVWS